MRSPLVDLNAQKTAHGIRQNACTSARATRGVDAPADGRTVARRRAAAGRDGAGLSDCAWCISAVTGEIDAELRFVRAGCLSGLRLYGLQRSVSFILCPSRVKSSTALLHPDHHILVCSK
jgi:hypothetical protein